MSKKKELFRDERLLHSLQSHVTKLKRDLKDQSQEQETFSSFWINEAQKKLQEQLNKKINTNIAKNVILFLGDGMSLSTITASRIYAGQRLKKSGEEYSLSFENFPFTALSKTYCVDKQTADSACSATAYLTGVKANFGTVGLNAKVKRNDCQGSLIKENRLSSIMQWAQDAGKSTGFVTTTRVTHASPAGIYARSASRDWESDYDMQNFTDSKECSDIAKQLVTESPGNKLNVIFGGGRMKFLSENIIENGSRGERLDGRDLIDEWIQHQKSANAHYVSNRTELFSLDYSKIDHILGLFADSHLEYNLKNDKDEPSLKEMTSAAIEILKKNDKGFVLFVEGGKIDVAHHDNMAHLALDETAEFDKAIQSAMELTDEKDTLIVVTADHSHTMTLSGYSHRGKDILGLNTEISSMDSMPYLTLSYANGPSAEKKRLVNEEEMKNTGYQYPSLVPLLYETHGGDDVPIYSRGPYSHLFEGVLEQNTIPHFIAYAACISNGATACD
ncbi:membrane-bound alkaline phosphatase-like [Chironomus tepperi]|uniref:membrane-bound alkaline phosphatase-like n=1 Tax=Chironomus tepperi TaxID=113505 RepID=UPI00391F9F03